MFGGGILARLIAPITFIRAFAASFSLTPERLIEASTLVTKWPTCRDVHVLALGQNSELLTELKCVNPPAAWLRGSPHISCHGPTQGPVYPKGYIYIGYLSSFVHKYVYSYLSRRKERDYQRPRTTLTLLYSYNLSEAVDQTDPCALRHPGCAPSAEHPLAHACAPQGLGTCRGAERCRVLCTMQWLPLEFEVHWSDWMQPETPASRTPAFPEEGGCSHLCPCRAHTGNRPSCGPEQGRGD